MVIHIKSAAETFRHFIVNAYADGYLNSDSHAELQEAVDAFADLDERVSAIEHAMKPSTPR